MSAKEFEQIAADALADARECKTRARNAEDNARELLTALQAIVDAEPASGSYPGDGWRLAHEKFAAYARAAIVKATGGAA